MRVVVQKYGGSSVSDPEKLRLIAKKVCAVKDSGFEVVVVVSAMGKTTNELANLSRLISKNPPRRELDMLLTAGERISAALLSIAIHEEGKKSVSLTGSQCGIITNDRHTDAKIIEVRPVRVEDALSRDEIVIVAGFQGMSYKREITTLGRGGSDTTAVALAAALEAESLEIYSDVDGVYSCDPNTNSEAKHIPSLSYEEMQEMSESGAKVLKADAVELAKKAGIAIYARSSFTPGRQTVIRKYGPSDASRISAVVSEKKLAWIGFLGRAVTEHTEDILEETRRLGVTIKEFRFNCPYDVVSWARGSFIVSTSSVPDWSKAKSALIEKGKGELEILEKLSAISLIGVGINYDTKNVVMAMSAVKELGARIFGLSTTSFRISIIIDDKFHDEALKKLHEIFIEKITDSS